MITTCAGLVAAVKAAAAGAIITLSAGHCPRTVFNLVTANNVTVNATGSSFDELDFYTSSGITFNGGEFDNSTYAGVGVLTSNNIVLKGIHCVGPGTACITISKSDHIEVNGGAVEQSKGDGVDVAASSFVHVHYFTCSNNVVTAIHPDCVQGWSIPATATVAMIPLTDFEVDHNVAVGPTQGFDVWDAFYPSNARVHIHDNIASVNQNCSGLYNATDGLVENNLCIGYPGSVVKSKVSTEGQGNVTFTNNTVGVGVP
jgi:hypothetical protein